MFPWEGKDVATASALVATRDPREYRVGLLTTGPWPDGSTHALYWFVRHPEMAQFLLRVEPRYRGLQGAAFIDFKTRAQDLVTALEVTGPSEDLRQQLNAEAQPRFGVRWWGTLESLKAGDGDWPRQVLERLTGGKPLENRRTEELVRYLQREYPAAGPSAPGGD